MLDNNDPRWRDSIWEDVISELSTTSATSSSCGSSSSWSFLVSSSSCGIDDNNDDDFRRVRRLGRVMAAIGGDFLIM